MKTILSLATQENQGKGEMTLIVARGHASVQLIVECLALPENAVNVYLRPGDALQLANALQAAAAELEFQNVPLPIGTKWNVTAKWNVCK